ncbi:MAG: L,D-transpeptidase family protein [Magnetospirillum sp.]|nr:L,D-transpeptidase family protein [Magnetospirillum sp.]
MRRTLALCAIVSGGLYVLIHLSGIPVHDQSRVPFPDGLLADRIVIEKAKHKLTIYKEDRPIRTYQASLGRGGLEAKAIEGDGRTPEGAYRIAGRNSRSAYHLSLKISYPELRDIEAARLRGQSPGGDIMIHGIRNGLGWVDGLHRWVDWTAGCVAVTNDEIEELWRVVPDDTPVEIRP